MPRPIPQRVGLHHLDEEFGVPFPSARLTGKDDRKYRERPTTNLSDSAQHSALEPIQQMRRRPTPPRPSRPISSPGVVFRAMTKPSTLVLSALLLLSWGAMPTTSFAIDAGSRHSPGRAVSRLAMVASTTVNDAASASSSEEDMPEQDSSGMYHILNGDQHKALIEATKDKMVIMKVFAPWCRACKGLEPKFNAIVKDTQKKGLPIVFADFTIQHNKEYIKSIGVLALPTVQFYVHGGLNDNFPCGPSKVPILKRKLEQFVNQYVDQDTLSVLPPGMMSVSIPAPTDSTADDTAQDAASASASASASSAASASASTSSSSSVASSSSASVSVGASAPILDPMAKTPPLETVRADSGVSQKERERIRQNSFMSEFTDEEFDSLMAKANLLSFDAGSIIMREGNIGRTFYIIIEGEVEICQKTLYEDPLSTPPTYLGTVINRLESFDFFGERALITEEPRAASIRASANPTKCLAFDKDDFPATSILRGRSARQTDDSEYADAVERVQTADDKYGVGLKEYSSSIDRQYSEIAKANQVRGSVNKPNPIAGVDNDDVDFDLAVESEQIIPLLMRFKLIRLVTRCFDYIMANRPRFGEEGSRRRRSMLVKLLTPTQHVEFTDAFTLIDKDSDGEITLIELRRLMDSISEDRTDDELSSLLETGHGQQTMSYQDFMGLMAEAEFYHLFLETFQSLDTNNSGFVRAKDLDRVLCGIRDLISDDRKSIIDVEDTDILIDYEQFSKMLLGTALK